MVPCIFLTALSAALMTVPDYAAAYETGDATGLIAEVFRPWGGGGKVSHTPSHSSFCCSPELGVDYSSSWSSCLSASFATVPPTLIRLPSPARPSCLYSKRSLGLCGVSSCLPSTASPPAPSQNTAHTDETAVAAVAGREHFSEVLTDFLSILGCTSPPPHLCPESS